MLIGPSQGGASGGRSFPGPWHMPGGPCGGHWLGKAGHTPRLLPLLPTPPTSESWQPTPRPSRLQLGLPSSVVQTHPPGPGPPCELTRRPENLTQWLPGVGEMNGEAQGIFRAAKPSSTILSWWRNDPPVQTRRMYNTKSEPYRRCGLGLITTRLVNKGATLM